jgi:hypothetical protein
MLPARSRRWFVLSVSLSLTMVGSAWARQGTVGNEPLIRGAVVDSATGHPIGYALVSVVGTEIRLFTTEQGQFVLRGLKPGTHIVRAQQIGFRPSSVSLSVGKQPPAALTIILARQAVQLPEIRVSAGACAAGALRGGDAQFEPMVEEVFRNAERLLALEKSFPFRGNFEKTVSVLDSAHRVVDSRITTVRFDTREIVGYRKGQVIEGRRGIDERWNYFAPSDLARDAFLASHCFWYVGFDRAMDGQVVHRIDFAPRVDVRSPDWAGSLLIDTTSRVLVQTRSRLVNLPLRRGGVTRAECAVLYRALAPTIPQEFRAECTTTRAGDPTSLLEQWDLRSFSFVGRNPLQP